jgi:hypothetical protein
VALDGVASRWAEARARSLGSEVLALLLALAVSQHPDEDGSERPILLAVDQQLGERTALGVAPELADPVGPLEVGEHQDVEQLGAGSRPHGVEMCPQSALELVGTHGRQATLTGPRVVSSVTGGLVNWLMRLSFVTFVVSLSVWGVIAVWGTVRVYELMRTWQIIAVSLAVVSGLVMLALLVQAAWARLRR